MSPRSPTENDPDCARGFWQGVRAAAAAKRHRHCVVLAGDETWSRARIEPLLTERIDTSIWIGANAPDGIRSLGVGRSRTLLGQEAEVLIWDVRAGFDPDALGVLSGVLRAGGLLVLVTPSLHSWPALSDPQFERIVPAGFHGPRSGRWLHRFLRVLTGDPSVPVWRQGERPPELPARSGGGMPATASAQPALSPSPDQQQAISAIEAAATGHRNRPVVLTSDRGRGKTSALGMAAARLLNGRAREIVITAPRPAAVAAAFEWAARCSDRAPVSPGELHIGEGRLRFMAPDALMRERPQMDMLLVDEAAAIPGPVLETLLERHHRIVFATTVHGYEGSGRGFALRFMEMLRRRGQSHRVVHLTQPIRWAAGDPLERFVNDALLLEAEPASESALTGASGSNCSVQWLDRDVLAADEALLKQVFGLLIQAHYQTTPLDLRHLLDGPQVAIGIARWADQVAGVVQVQDEGGLSPGLAAAIWAGRRRPRGHLIPQSLATHLGFEQGPMLRCSRVVRIAVHPTVRYRGIGSCLLRAAERRAGESGADLIGVSFGAELGLLAFWARHQLKPVRIGYRRDASSGAHSVILLKGLSTTGKALRVAAGRQFRRHFQRQLSESHRDLEPDLVMALLNLGPVSAGRIDRHGWRAVAGFGSALRPYQACAPELRVLALRALSSPRFATCLSRAHGQVLVVKVLQQQGWSETAAALSLPGRSQVIALLRNAARVLVMHLGDAELRGFADTLNQSSNDSG